MTTAALQPRILLLIVAALIAFAANSVLGRLGLEDGSTDPASFTAVRLVAGSLMLLLLVRLSQRDDRAPRGRGSWHGGLMLFAYAACFSYAYVSLATGTGAVILFGAVQLTIILASLLSGHRLRRLEWLGVALAFAGFVYLMLPGIDAPDPFGFVLMALAGIAWGFYTLIGRGSSSPLTDTAFNFTRTVPMVVLLLAAVIMIDQPRLSERSFLLAAASGAITSGIGYAIWYRVLPSLTPTQAAVLQLLVPVLAALGGVVLVSEPLTLRLVLASLLILGGILLVIEARRRG
ncbi:DMT family transporter [Motiliproteus sediminis]|uniref:DMT family transporter n=1 Tax=Motiliproteus sediminis TaxID=1468178 RepID=UPI001AEFDA3B|nr:DMT family transporter [Motiliproteus sediminis]